MSLPRQRAAKRSSRSLHVWISSLPAPAPELCTAVPNFCAVSIHTRPSAKNSPFCPPAPKMKPPVSQQLTTLSRTAEPSNFCAFTPAQDFHAGRLRSELPPPIRALSRRIVRLFRLVCSTIPRNSPSFPIPFVTWPELIARGKFASPRFPAANRTNAAFSRLSQR